MDVSRYSGAQMGAMPLEFGLGWAGRTLSWGGGGGEQDGDPQTAHNLPAEAPASWGPQPCGLPDRVSTRETDSQPNPISLPLPSCVRETHVATVITQSCFLAPSAQPYSLP